MINEHKNIKSEINEDAGKRQVDLLVSKRKARLIGPTLNKVIHVCGHSDHLIYTTFGSFRKTNLTWIVDERWKIEAC